MSATTSPAPDADSLVTAVGLVWGWLEQGQADQALVLVRGCIQCWPEQAVLHLLEQQCLLSLNLPLAGKSSINLATVPASWQTLVQRLAARQRLNQRATVQRDRKSFDTQRSGGPR